MTTIQNNKQLTISTAGSRKAVRWQTSTLYWSELLERLAVPVRSTESLAEYLRMPKGRQDDLKDVGGFVAGTLANGQRKAGSVTGRDVITLDLDNISSGETDNVLKRIDSLGCAYAVYSTRKHEPIKPRLRTLFPLNRTVSADEYEAIARKLGDMIGMEMCDPSTFEPSRLMYWPSCCADSQYVYVYGDKPFADADGILLMYSDWHDLSSWPQVPGAPSVQKLAERQTDPTTKPGTVGAFCRIYDIYRVLDELLPGVYEPCGIEGRYTYRDGSTTGGAVIYDNGNFLYSHHATDPAGGKLCNAFDLVRLHKFGHLDDDAKPETPANKLASYLAMAKYAIESKEVSTLLNQERYDKATQDFTTPVSETANWISKLAISPTTGAPAKTVDNVLLILENDPLLKGKLAFDEFANRGLALGALPWDDRTERREWTDVDDAGLRHYIEHTQGITGRDRVYDGATLAAHRRKINDVRDYLMSVEWDGQKRLETLFIDYLGAEDNVYSRAVAKKSFTAAVARVMEPGCKYDYMPIICGPQGIGKSTLLRLMGKRWYSDSLTTFEGKEASELIQGTWINELGELNGLTKSETNAVKQFLSRAEDIYREPYGRRTRNYPRRCVFFGTTNDSEFLRDKTGNRRFWPLDVGLQAPTKNIFTQLEDEVDQLWAEAVCYWQLGERLYLTDEAEKISRDEQESHRESSAKEGIIWEFIERPVPVDWDKRDLQARRLYWNGEFGRESSVEMIKRDKVCAAEIWAECFMSDTKYMKRVDTLEINGILDNLKGWKKHKNPIRFPIYGHQRGYTKA
ncbi:MAG: VapE domain-containing protein [Eubacteriales bacterium]|jgi:putative DNA primase/helicase